MNDALRAGRFTSSQMFRLMGTPAVRKTYIKEVAVERKLGKSLSKEFWSKSTSWGTLMEVLAFNDLGMNWSLCSKDTIVHKKYSSFWSGTPDVKTKSIIGEIKGYEYKKFCEMTDAINSKKLENIKKLNKGKEYYQTVSNGILLNLKKGAVISYMPFEKDFEIVKDFIRGLDSSNPSQLYLHEECSWITFKQKGDVCLLPDNGHYNNLNKFEFEIPTEDIISLTKSVIEAEKEVQRIIMKL